MTDDEIESLVARFLDRSLPRVEWTHQAHLTVGLWALRRMGRPAATDFLREAIRRYNLSQNNPTGYHETITRAWIEVIARFLAEHDRGQPLSALASMLVASCGRRDYLSAFYTAEALDSDEARRGWVPPDVRPFAG
jgi:hypothetical protein